MTDLYNIDRLVGLLDTAPEELVELITNAPPGRNIGVSVLGSLPNIYEALLKKVIPRWRVSRYANPCSK